MARPVSESIKPRARYVFDACSMHELGGPHTQTEVLTESPPCNSSNRGVVQGLKPQASPKVVDTTHLVDQLLSLPDGRGSDVRSCATLHRQRLKHTITYIGKGLEVVDASWWASA